VTMCFDLQIHSYYIYVRCSAMNISFIHLSMKLVVKGGFIVVLRRKLNDCRKQFYCNIDTYIVQEKSEI